MEWSLLYAARADFACFKFCSGIQESSLAKYSFHQIRTNDWLEFHSGIESS